MPKNEIDGYAIRATDGRYWEGTRWTDELHEAKIIPASADDVLSKMDELFPGQSLQPVTLSAHGDPFFPKELGYPHAHLVILASGRRATVLKYAAKAFGEDAYHDLDADSESEALKATEGQDVQLVREILVDGEKQINYLDGDRGLWLGTWLSPDGKIVGTLDRPARACPRCGCTEFLVTAHVAQGWRVGPDGDFIECTNECEEVDHQPDDEDVWACAKCGYDAAGADFRA